MKLMSENLTLLYPLNVRGWVTAERSALLGFINKHIIILEPARP